jgi:hypothetical protein
VAGPHQLQLCCTNATHHVNYGDSVMAYLLVNQCARPREVMLTLITAQGAIRRPYLGTALTGMENTASLGAVPTGDSWLRIELAASDLGIEGQDLSGIYLDADALHDSRCGATDDSER